MTLPIVLTIALVCLVLEGFFSGSEIALINADKIKLERAAKKGSKGAELARLMLLNPGRLFSVTLLGTNISTVTASVTISLFIINKWGESYAPLAILWWPMTLIVGELVPKSLFQHYADKIVQIIALPLTIWSYITYPIGWVLSKLSSRLLTPFKRLNVSEPMLSRDDLENILEEGATSESDVEPGERTMILRVLDLADKKVENIMTPLVDVISLPSSSSREEAERIIEEAAHSRIPVFGKANHDIIGIITCSDVLFKKSRLGTKDMMRTPLYVPEEMPLDELLKMMRLKGEDMAIVVDEYGTSVGIVTAEDLLEEVVGEILDEHDKNAPLYRRVRAGNYIVSGRMEIEAANASLGLNIPEEGDFETIAGFIIHKMERIPHAGEEFTHTNWKIIIRKATPRAVLEVEVKRKK